MVMRHTNSAPGMELLILGNHSYEIAQNYNKCICIWQMFNTYIFLSPPFKFWEKHQNVFRFGTFFLRIKTLIDGEIMWFTSTLNMLGLCSAKFHLFSFFALRKLWLTGQVISFLLFYKLTSQRKRCSLHH